MDEQKMGALGVLQFDNHGNEQTEGPALSCTLYLWPAGGSSYLSEITI
jgi:hypothetical protein